MLRQQLFFLLTESAHQNKNFVYYSYKLCHRLNKILSESIYDESPSKRKISENKLLERNVDKCKDNFYDIFLNFCMVLVLDPTQVWSPP